MQQQTHNRNLRDRFSLCIRVRARACAYYIRQLSSWPPYAELGAQAGSICQVNAQPRPRPQQLPPTSLIILGEIVQKHTADTHLHM